MRKTHVNTTFQPGGHFTGDIGTQVETLISGFEGNTLIIQITGREEILILLSASGYIEIKLRTQGLLFHSITPIKIPQRGSTVYKFTIRAYRL